MTSSVPTAALAGEPLPADLVEVGVYRTAGEGFEHGLVALAAGWPFWLMPTENPGDGFRLMIEPAGEAHLREQLARFDRESVGWPPPPVDARTPRTRAELITPLLWALAVLGGFWAQALSRGWTAVGAVDARAIFDRGEVWRPATALFLHADLGHLISNTLSGIFVFSAMTTTVGRRRGWLLIAAAAVLGNLAAAGVNYPGDYRSVGASTAIFAGLGLLTGRAVRVVAGAVRGQRWRAVFAPLAAGLTVLGLFGAGGVEIDVLAHVTGFAAGLSLGFVAARLSFAKAPLS